MTKLNIGLQPDPRASRFGAGYARLGIAMEFLSNLFFDHGIKQANKRQKPTTRLQIDLHCLAVHKNTNKRTFRVPVRRESSQ